MLSPISEQGVNVRYGPKQKVSIGDHDSRFAPETERRRSAFVAPVLDPRRLELGAGQGAGGEDFDGGAHLAAAANFLDHGVGDPGASLVFDPHRHHVQSIGIGQEHDLELVADSGDRAHGMLDLAGKHLDAAQIDEVVGAPRERADRAYMGAAAWAARAIESGIVADQKTKLRRGFRIEVGADGQPARAVGLRLERLRIDRLPNLHVLEQMRRHQSVRRLRVRTREAADMGRGSVQP